MTDTARESPQAALTEIARIVSAAAQSSPSWISCNGDRSPDDWDPTQDVLVPM